MRNLFVLALAISWSAFGAGCETTVVVDDPIEPDATLTVANGSSYVITEIRLTSVDSATWGPNLIPDEMFPGESVILVDIFCDSYDVMVIDETGVACVLGDLSLCFADHTWVVDDATLDDCSFGY